MTSHSERLQDLAKALVEPLREACLSIAVVGSVSRHQADRHSDLELELFVESLPDQKGREDLIQGLGGTRIWHYPAPLADGSLWSIFLHQGTWVELGWQEEAAAAAVLDRLAQGETTRQDLLILVSTYQEALWLQDSPRMRACRARLNSYPPQLSQAILRDVLSQWDVELAWQSKAALACRGDRLALVQRLLTDCQRILRVLFALNQAWERDLKGLGTSLRALKILPRDVGPRLETLVSSDPRPASLGLARLVVETLGLIPDGPGLREKKDRVLGHCHRFEAELSG